MTSISKATELADAVIQSEPRRNRIAWPKAFPWVGKLPSKSEFAELKPATRVLLAALAGWMVLVVAISAIASVSVQSARLNMTGWLGAQNPTPSGLAAPKPSAYDNIVERPLFVRTRHAVAPVEQPEVQPVMPAVPSLDQNLTLKGIFIGEGKAKAFFVTDRNPVGVWVDVDREIEGWRLIGVSAGDVTLEGQAQRLVVPLTIVSRK